MPLYTLQHMPSVTDITPFLLYIRIIPIERFYCERKELICSLQVRILFSVLYIILNEKNATAADPILQT